MTDKHNDRKIDGGGDFRLAVLRDLGNQLQIKAEKMRLLARAEEGLGDGEYNPYTSAAVPPDTAKLLVEIKTAEFGLAPVKPETGVVVSTARQRRRNKKVKPGSTGHTTVDIKQYRPGYTWNRGGRMKEIRIRHLARKFLYLWKSKIFGRLTPSEAREHYRKQLLRTTFKVWHDMWWVLRKEWRLEVRAECHHRYILWQKTFRAWKEFIVRKRVKNAKVAVAEKHASCKLKKKCIMGWWLYVHSRRQKNERKKIAVAHHSRHLLSKYWQQWLMHHNVIQHRQHMESVALQFWAYRIQAQYWLIWQSKLSEKRASVMKHYQALRHNNNVVVRRCLKAWVVYWNTRRRKVQEKELCKKIYENTLVQQAFGHWLKEFHIREHIKARQKRITELGEMFQKRRLFLHWKHYVLLQREKYEHIADAENHYRRKLLRMGFSAFRLCEVQKRLKIMRTTMADQLRYRQLTRWGWLTWLQRCENKEELLIVTQSHKAWIYYRTVLLRKSFNQLRLYAEWRKYRQAQYAKADAHFYMQEMPKYMFALKVFVQLMKNNRENAEKAKEFRRENTLARFFYGWTNQFEFSKESRMNERMAILHYDDKLARRFFRWWKQKTLVAQREAEKEGLAVEHYSERLCQNHFKAWRNYIVFLKKSQRQDIEASRYYCRKIMKKSLRAWIQYTTKRKEKKRKLDRAKNHYNRHLCQKMVAMWLHYVDTQRTIKARVAVLYRKKCTQFLGEAFHQWRQNVEDQKLERNSGLVAEAHYRLRIQEKIFTAWHRFSAIHAYKKSETRQWVASAQQHLELKMQEIYFFKWKEYHAEHVSMRLKYAKALQHHNVKVMIKVMVTWKLFTKETIRKSLLQKQSLWFHNMRLTARYFIAWKHAKNAADVEKQKSSLALWHWCLNLHRKVLIAWYDYTLQRKHKKLRVQEAMERRRARLLKDGLGQWLRVADDLSAMRKQFAIQQQAKSVYEISQVVLRCGLHWKVWACKRRQVRGGPKPSTAQRATCGAVSSKGDKSVDIGKSASSTPRFPVSLFNTPREATPGENKDTISAVQKEPLVPALTLTASPGRTLASRGRSQSRSRPRQPSFLMESLKRAGLFVHDTSREHNADSNEQRSHTPVERLNLSNLTTNPSDVESDRTLTPHLSQPYQHMPISDRSDQTGSTFTPRVPFQNMTDFQEPVHCGTQSGSVILGSEPLGKFVETQKPVRPLLHEVQTVQGTHLLGTRNANEIKVGNLAGTVTTYAQHTLLSAQPVPNLPKLALMTPADFLKKSDTTVIQKSTSAMDACVPRTTMNARSTVPSERTSVASTPRVMCQNSDHNHPLSETRSFRISDFKEQITPRSTTSYASPREDLSSPGFEVQSTQQIQKEIFTIRNKLKSFDQKKKKLRTMQKQLKQLSDWLKEMEDKGQGADDDDVMNARQEVQELSSDVDSLKQLVEEEKVHCSNLVERVKVLTSQLTA